MGHLPAAVAHSVCYQFLTILSRHSSSPLPFTTHIHMHTTQSKLHYYNIIVSNTWSHIISSKSYTQYTHTRTHTHTHTHQGCSHALVRLVQFQPDHFSDEKIWIFNNNHTLNCLFRPHAVNFLPRRCTCWSSLWWQRKSLYRRSPMSPIIPRQGFSGIGRNF